MKLVEPRLDTADILFGRALPARGRDEVGIERRSIFVESIDFLAKRCLSTLGDFDRAADRFKLRLARLLALGRRLVAASQLTERVVGHGSLRRAPAMRLSKERKARKEEERKYAGAKNHSDHMDNKDLTLCPMVGVAGKDCRRSVKLFRQQNPGQLVRPGCPSEGQSTVGALQQPLAQPVRAADDEDRARHCGLRVPGKGRRKRIAVGDIAIDGKADNAVALLDAMEQRPLFLGDAILRPRRA